MTRLLIATLLFVAACGPQAEQQPGAAASPEAPAPTAAGVPQQRDVPSMDAGAAATPDQGVHLIEYAIHMPQTLKAGRQSFQIENAGKEMHSFAIEGNGVQARLPSELSRGSSARFETQLQPGTYTVYCPVGDHRKKGMHTQIVVE